MKPTVQNPYKFFLTEVTKLIKHTARVYIDGRNKGGEDR